MKKSICVAGNMIVDILYPILGYPKKGELTTIADGIGRTSGGAVCNVAIDIARLLPDAKVSALGAVGTDDEGQFVINCLNGANVDTEMVKRRGKTSFTAVMADRETNERTFFQYRGANATFSEADIDWDKMDCDLFHIGYILLLDALDAEDAEYGTKMARLLRDAKAHGIKTSIDVVTESGERFKKLVPPALRYTDYCIINELETQETTGISLRGADGKLLKENMKAALSKLHELGVGEWAVIHAPEGGFGMDKNGVYTECGRLNYPDGWIKGTVGAGDAFCAGVLSGAEMGLSISEAVRLGNCAAVASLSAPGATEGMMTAEECLRMGSDMGHCPIN